jgi:hypothetical protein
MTIVRIRCFHVIGSDDFRLSDLIGFRRFRQFPTIGSYRILSSESDRNRRRKSSEINGLMQVSDSRNPIGSDYRKLSDSAGSDRIRWGEFDLGTCFIILLPVFGLFVLHLLDQDRLRQVSNQSRVIESKLS